MLRNKITLFKLLGFSVSIDASWMIILFLVVWSLAKGLFPSYYPDLSQLTYWLMGLAGAVGLFVSIIIHEFSHSLVARRHGLAIRGITLFIFGGVAEMTEEPETPKSEFFMAIAGPIASLMLSLLFAVVYQIGDMLEWATPAMGIIGYLSAINMLLVVFNLVPAFPTDGGRILRSVLWWIKDDIYWATRLASRISLIFATAIIFVGFVNLVSGNFIGGLWWILIGSFLFNAAGASYRHLLTERSFGGKTVRYFMNPDPVTVPSDITLQTFVEKYIYHYHFKMYPVAEGGSVTGIVTVQELKAVPREEWPRLSVGSLMQPQTEENSIAADAPVKQALNQMNMMGLSRLLVLDRGRMVGIITLKDLLEYLALKMELEELR